MIEKGAHSATRTKSSDFIAGDIDNAEEDVAPGNSRYLIFDTVLPVHDIREYIVQ